MLSITPPSVASRAVTSTTDTAPRPEASGRKPLDPINIRNAPVSLSQQQRSATLASQIFPELLRFEADSTEARVSQLMKAAPNDQVDRAPGRPRALSAHPTPGLPSSPIEERPAAARPVSEAQRDRALRFGALIFSSTLVERGFHGRPKGEEDFTSPVFRCLMRDQPTAIPKPGPGSVSMKAMATDERASRIPRLQRPT